MDALPVEKGLAYVLGVLLLMALAAIGYLFRELRLSDGRFAVYAKQMADDLRTLNNSAIAVIERNSASDSRLTENISKLEGTIDKLAERLPSRGR